MSFVMVGVIAVGVAMMANNNGDSPVLWGIVTFISGVVGSSAFGLFGAILGAFLGAALYIAKTLKYG